MKPSGRLPRYTRLQSSGRPRPKKRSAAERERIYGEDGRAAFVKAQPCLICGRTPSDNAHLTNGGTGRKDNAERTVPLCPDAPGWRGHHSEYDGGKKSFRARYADRLWPFTLEEWAQRIEQLWQWHQRQPAPLSAIVPNVMRQLEGGDAA